jgi:large subunit ribosomal protein L31
MQFGYVPNMAHNLLVNGDVNKKISAVLHRLRVAEGDTVTAEYEDNTLPSPYTTAGDIHPESYRPVVFKDSASGFSFLSKSCARTTQTVKWEDGQEYPLVILGISSASHPFYTGQQVFVDTAGRVDKFQQRLAKTKEAQEKAAAFKKRKR